MHVEGFRTALTTVVNKYARAKTLLKEKDDNLLGEDIREGIDGDRLGEAARPAVRGPDQGQARQRPDALVRPEGHQRAARRVARGEPDRGQQGRQEGARRGAGSRGGEERPQRHPSQDGADRRRHAGQAEGLLQPQAPTRASCSSSRATRPAAPPSTRAIRARRRSCRSAARSSTSSGRASTRC